MSGNILLTVQFFGLFYLINCRISCESSLEGIDIAKALIVNKEWNCSLSSELLDANITEDSHLYKNISLFFARRSAAKHYLRRQDWSEIVASAWREIALGKEGKITREFRHEGLYDPLSDFVEHIHYFQLVRRIMLQRGENVSILGKQHSTIHDVDKLHPVMLAGYAEKFEDQKDTSLWKACVDNHIAINPHHQGNSLWQVGYCSKPGFTTNLCDNFENLCYNALLEMICDKVSRKVQKELDGKISEDMWNVDRKFFLGLPETWIDKAYEILENLKRS